MSNDNNLEKAKKTFKTLCSFLDKDEWHYKKNQDDLTIECSARGEDLPIEITVKIDAKRSLVLLLSHMPFSVPEDKRMDIAIAVSVANNLMVDGCFDYDIKDGTIFFRMSNSFLDSEIGKELFQYMVLCSCMTIDEYNDKFLMIAKGLMSIEKFLENTLN